MGSPKALLSSKPPAGSVGNRAVDRQRALGIPEQSKSIAPPPPTEAAAPLPKRSEDSLSAYAPKVLGDAQFVRTYVLQDVSKPANAEIVLALLKGYEAWDTAVAASNPAHGHGNLDAIFLAIARLAAIDDGLVFTHYRLPTDILWFDLAEPYRDEYRRLYAKSSLGAHRRPDEGKNYGKEMAKQEAIGVLGILKGVAVSAAGLVDDARFVLPGTGKDDAAASKVISSTFDDAMKWWVGDDWEHGEAVMLGLSAAELGELGGSIVFTLATLEVKALKIVSTILMYPAMARGLDGMLDRLGTVYLEDRDAGKSAAADPRLWQEIVGIVGSLLGLLLSKTASGQRIGTKIAHAVLDGAPLGPIAAKIVQAALSKDPPEEKRRVIGLALGEALQLLCAIAGGRLKDKKLGGGGKQEEKREAHRKDQKRKEEPKQEPKQEEPNQEQAPAKQQDDQPPLPPTLPPKTEAAPVPAADPRAELFDFTRPILDPTPDDPGMSRTPKGDARFDRDRKLIGPRDKSDPGTARSDKKRSAFFDLSKPDLGEWTGTTSRYKDKDASGERIVDPRKGMSNKRWKDYDDRIAAAPDPAAADAIRHERWREKNGNRLDPDPDMTLAEWSAMNPQNPGSRSGAAIKRGVELETEALAKREFAQSNNAAGQRLEHTQIDPVTGKPKTTRPDGVDGLRIGEAKYIAPDSVDQVVPDTEQMRAQRALGQKLAAEAGLPPRPHEVIIISENGSRLAEGRPRPHDAIVAAKSEVYFYDPTQQRVTHKWENGQWQPIP